jgi:hypothetical protein
MVKKKIEGFDTPFDANSNELYNIIHFAAFTADVIHLKKPLVGRRPYRSPPARGLTNAGELI